MSIKENAVITIYAFYTRTTIYFKYRIGFHTENELM